MNFAELTRREKGKERGARRSDSLPVLCSGWASLSLSLDSRGSERDGATLPLEASARAPGHVMMTTLFGPPRRTSPACSCCLGFLRLLARKGGVGVGRG